ncbi:hypothetical protein [Parablautia muri]|uniref:Uncharacterized protein n=1 Tax=Parablautia muri TaxID=2320879 RepID=A0A9X5BEQ2_9FIRM|nr:hypothetical protein [Parablautia muri]NBJ92433.1 hypothetical protein [Parablautia muri]
MVKELNQEKLRKKKEKEKQKQQKKRWKRINARVEKTVYLLVLGICITYSFLEVQERMQRFEKTQ